jgi:16S rRNA (guanine527-N7)-methyltransferase
MGTLAVETISELLGPYLGAQGTPILYRQLSDYLDLLVKWNARTNLTAIRDPEEIVRRHFGESLFAGRQVGSGKTLLDFGSGAGFPGIPIQLLRSEMVVTLAESQGKKAAFLREAVRSLGLRSQVWAGRVEEMSEGVCFEVVAMRAVDRMGEAVIAGRARVSLGGQLVVLTTEDRVPGTGRVIRIPNSEAGVVYREMFHVKPSV